MALSQPASRTEELLTENNELLRQLIAKQVPSDSHEAIKKTLESILHSSEGCADKLSNLELRQCLSSGEGTDAARHLGTFLGAGGAHFSSTHSQVILEKLLSDGTEGITYEGFFADKDSRRAEVLLARAYYELVEGHTEDLGPDPTSASEDCLKVAKLCPAFKTKMLQAAGKADNLELGATFETKASETPTVNKVLDIVGEVPKDLQEAHKWMLPLNKGMYPVSAKTPEPLGRQWTFENLGDEGLQTSWDKTPEAFKKYVKWMTVDGKLFEDADLTKMHPKLVFTECFLSWAEGRKISSERHYRTSSFDFAEKCKADKQRADEFKAAQKRYKVRHEYNQVFQTAEGKLAKEFFAKKKDIETFEGDEKQVDDADHLGFDF